MASLDKLKLSIVLSTHQARFEAVAFKGDFENNIAKIAGWGYDGVELAICDPDLINIDTLERVLSGHGIKLPAIGTGQAWGEEGLSFHQSKQRSSKCSCSSDQTPDSACTSIQCSCYNWSDSWSNSIGSN